MIERIFIRLDNQQIILLSPSVVFKNLFKFCVNRFHNTLREANEWKERHNNFLWIFCLHGITNIKKYTHERIKQLHLNLIKIHQQTEADCYKTCLRN